MNTYSTSVIRVLSTLLVGWLLSLGLLHPILVMLNLTDTAKLNAAVTLVLSGAWYALGRAIEQRWPRAGVIFGVPSAPSYSAQAGTSTPDPFVDSPNVPDLLGTAASLLVRLSASTGLSAPSAAPQTTGAPAPVAGDTSMETTTGSVS